MLGCTGQRCEKVLSCKLLRRDATRAPAPDGNCGIIMEADNVPSLLTLCLDALTRRQVAEHQPKRSAGSPGSFWESNEECAATPAAILLSQLPLPAESKLMTLRTLRHAGMLSDEALLRLTDESFECLNLASCRSVSAALTMLPLSALCSRHWTFRGNANSATRRCLK